MSPQHEVDAAILSTTLPECYAIIDALISLPEGVKPPKDLLVKARRILPKQYANSFEKAR